MNSLQRNSDIEVSYIQSGKSFDAMRLEKNFDVILLYENSFTPCNPNELKNIKKLGIPVVAKVGDLWNSKNFDISESHEKYGITSYFGYQHKDNFYKHIGIYAFRANILEEITKLSPSKSEIQLNLEQLRWLDNKFKIKVGITEFGSLSVDTTEDIDKIVEVHSKNS